MKTVFPLLALLCVSLSVTAQTKPAARKPATSAVRSTATHSGRPQSVAAPVPNPATRTTSSVRTTPATYQPAPAVQQTAEAPVGSRAVANSRYTTQRGPARQPGSLFQLGFRVGGNFSTIGGINAAGLGEGVKLARVGGFHGGLVVNVGSSAFSVQPEILYTQYGVRMTLGSDYLQLKYNLVEVPVLFKATFGQPSLRVFVNAGPVAAYTASGAVSVRDGGQSQSQPIDMTNDGRFSFGAAGGAGVAVQMGPGSILLEGRYSYLFSSNDGGEKLKPQNAMLSVGYLMPLGGR